MTSTASPLPFDAIRSRLLAFAADRWPWAADLVAASAAKTLSGRRKPTEKAIEAARPRFRRELSRRLTERLRETGLETDEITPQVKAGDRFSEASKQLLEDCDGALRREAIRASFTKGERLELLQGMLWTRGTDNRLKAFFASGEVRYKGSAFQGKGFRSLGQEAIYAAALRLRRGKNFVGADGSWRGDVVAPLIRDLGVLLAMESEEIDAAARGVLSAQMAKADSPMGGKDLHVGRLDRGVFPAAAPLTISSLAAAGFAFAFDYQQRHPASVLSDQEADQEPNQEADQARDQRAEGGTPPVAVAFIGEGGTSLGEWHEAINLCATRRLPAIFCVQNNQTALSTPVHEQSAVRSFADKAAGYGVPGLSIDGTDPEAIAAAFTWAAERARGGAGPTLIEVVAMRMCGHAHHDDMLYLGKEPKASWDYPELTPSGYANAEDWSYWSARDPIQTYADWLEGIGLLKRGDLERLRSETEARVEAQAQEVIKAPWPDAEQAGVGVYADRAPCSHHDPLAAPRRFPSPALHLPALPALEVGPEFDPKGRTFLDAITLGVGDALEADPRVFVYGEDVGGRYGNAFLLLRPLLEKYGERLLNAPIAEAGILGVAIGAALAGLRPVAEMQFNDFVATGFNQLVNSAAKIRYRWGGSVPMVVRMPWGGLRKAGPYHSQNTEAWFYRTPGLKIVAPSTPSDARALFAAAVADEDPVLFYEHIALYRDPRIKQKLETEAPKPLPLGRAALRRAGSDLAIISYGAYVHVACRVADKLAEDGIAASVLDLRSLVPLDRESLLQVAAHCGKVLIVHEDTRTGGLGESIAAILQEEIFEYLDAPIRIVGALDTPVPYSPPLEAAFLPSEAWVEAAARRLVAY